MPRLLSAVLLAAVVCGPAPAAGPLEFHLTFDKRAHDRPFTGRVYVMLFRSSLTELQQGANWFRPEPFFAQDVKGWKPGEPAVIDRTALAFPVTLDRVARGKYTVQAVMDRHPDHIHFSTAPGNVYTIAKEVVLDPGMSGPVKLHLDRIYQERPFVETERVKLVEIESKLLTKFRGRPTKMRAGVALPATYAKDPTKKYPVIYEVPGFGGDHHGARFRGFRNPTDVAGVETIHVTLDPACHHGHHVFADSANNGPVGQALVEELIPAIEQRFRAIGKPAGRFVTGHSSGGWSSLWLQVTYPDFFGGCWSTAPDPVDFRDFQRINIYRPGENMFVDPDGNKRPIARRGNTPTLWYKAFSDMEEVMGHGGQLRSFDAVFSQRGADRQPRKLWDRKTGAIDPAVAKNWEKYDIRLVLERNWATLGPKLVGKIHIYMGDQDTFYLEGATVLLKDSLRKLKSDAVVELFPGKNHGSLMSPDLRARIAREMAGKYKKAFPEE